MTGKAGEATASTRQKVINHLASQPPFTAVELAQIYALVGADERNAVRAAVSDLAAGTTISKQHNVPKFYAIRLALEYAPGESREIYLTLPGVPREQVEMDRASDPTVADIRQALERKYGQYAIGYWAVSAQRRSVDQAQSAMMATTRKEPQCRLCTLINQWRSAATPSMPPIQPGKSIACHILSRKVSFWLILQKVDEEIDNIFSDEGANRVISMLRADVYTSDPRFIAPLCRDHNKLVLQMLKAATS